MRLASSVARSEPHQTAHSASGSMAANATAVTSSGERKRQGRADDDREMHGPNQSHTQRQVGRTGIAGSGRQRAAPSA